MLKGIKNIILDLGGVIINLNQSKTQESFQQLFPKKFNQISTPLIASNFFEDFEIGKISNNEFIHQFQQIDNNVSAKQIINAWNSMLLDIPKERIELIKKLGKQYNVFLLSNTNDIHYQFINEYVKAAFNISDFSKLFDKIYLSYHIKLRKPNKEIFQYVLDDAKINPIETLFIDDSLEHINSSKSLGIQAHHLNLEQNQSLTKYFNEY